MELYERMKNEKKYLEGKIKLAKEEQKKMPNGRIECHKRGEGWRWFVVKNGERKLLSHKTDYKEAEQLAYKRKLQIDISAMESEIEAIKGYLTVFESGVFSERVNGRARENKEINRLADKYRERLHPELANWLNEGIYVENEENVANFGKEHREITGYVKNGKVSIIRKEGDLNEFKTEGLTVSSKTGRKVRSKTEAYIDGALYDHKLFYKYEPVLELNNPFAYNRKAIVRPDFAVWSGKKKGPIYWEHFGMMDDLEYLRQTTEKLKLYMFNGYIPMDNLIITTESKNNPIDLQWVETIIDYFFN